MITLQNITLRRGTHVLLKQLNWTIYHKQRLGIIGANGCGKSSLFSMLLREVPPDEGELNFPRHIKLAHVAQDILAVDKLAVDFVLDGDAELRDLQLQLQQAETSHDGERIGYLHEKIDIIDGYSAKARAGQLLSGLGFAAADHSKPVSSFSGGWRVRLNIAKALMCRSDLLLLDEPTNHLDLDAIIWLQEWLKKYAGTLLMISHDRDFLDETVNHIAYISQQQLKVYIGDYSSFEKQRAAELALQQASYEKQQKKIAHMQAFVDRFRAKATKAKQAQSRLKAIERMEHVSAVQTESPFQFSFKKPASCPNPLLGLHRASIGYKDKIVLQGITLQIAPKDRIAIVGPNGAGKSSLIKVLAGEIDLLQGERECTTSLKIGYFAQHQMDKLILDENSLQHLRFLSAQSTELELRTFLGSFGFSGDKVLEPVSTFSGGEKSRLALALLVWQKPNLLLLDEPTNHLDLQMRNALSLALQEYEGAMLLVSHDRFLIRSTTDQLMLLADGKVVPFSGDLVDYQAWLMEFRKQNRIENEVQTKNLSKKEERQQAAKQRDLLRPLVQKIKKLEMKIETLQKKSAVIEMALSDCSLYETVHKEKLRNYLTEQVQLKSELNKNENEWLQACEELDLQQR